MITIAESKITDTPLLTNCVRQVAKEKKFLASASGFSTKQTARFIKSIIESQGIQLICRDGDLIIGWCDIMPGPFIELKHCGHLGMGILKVYRFQGLGKKLLNRIINQAFNKDFERIELEVFDSNTAAIALYEKFGFKKEGHKRKARKLDGNYDDILIYALLKEEWPNKKY